MSLLVTRRVCHHVVPAVKVGAREDGINDAGAARINVGSIRRHGSTHVDAARVYAPALACVTPFDVTKRSRRVAPHRRALHRGRLAGGCPWRRRLLDVRHQLQLVSASASASLNRNAPPDIPV